MTRADVAAGWAPQLVTLRQVEMLWRPLTDEDAERVMMLAVVAEQMLSAQWPVQVWLSSGVLSAELVAWGVVEMVRVAATSDDGAPLKSEQHTAGPFQHTTTFETAREAMRVPQSLWARLNELSASQGTARRVHQAWAV